MSADFPIEADLAVDRRRYPQDRRGGQRQGGRRLEDLAANPRWQGLLARLSRQVFRMFDNRGWSIAMGARTAKFSESAIQDLLKTRTDPKLSTLFKVAEAAGCELLMTFRPLSGTSLQTGETVQPRTPLPR